MHSLTRTRSVPALYKGFCTSFFLERRIQLAKFLDQNKYFHILFFVLLIFDVVVVLSEIFWDLDVLGKNDCLTNTDCPKLRLVRNGTSLIEDGSTCTYNTSYSECVFKNGAHRCLPVGTEASLNPEDVLHAVGLTILSLFTFEIFLKMFALGREFFDFHHRKLEMFDAFVVLSSLTLDMVFTYSVHAHDSTQKGADLLILLRLWRFARILNGSVIATDRREAGRHKTVLNMCANCELTTTTLNDLVNKLQSENARLKKELEGLRQTTQATVNDFPALNPADGVMTSHVQLPIGGCSSDDIVTATAT